MEFIFFWLLFSFIVGAVGSGRKIGFGLSFVCSLVLSPLIGLIITLFSESKSSYEIKKQSFELQKQQSNLLHEIKSNTGANNLILELEKLNNLKESGALTEDEYIKIKQKILDSPNDVIYKNEDTNDELSYIYKKKQNDRIVAFVGVMFIILAITFIMFN